MEEIAGDCFLLLINIFQDEDAHIYTHQFIVKLADAYEHIDDDNTLNSLISI